MNRAVNRVYFSCGQYSTHCSTAYPLRIDFSTMSEPCERFSRILKPCKHFSTILKPCKDNVLNKNILNCLDFSPMLESCTH